MRTRLNRKIGNVIRKKARPEMILPKYKQWVSAVFKRDRGICQKCGKKSSKSRHIQAHHIRRWADCPALRYDVNNGITLCVGCHKSIFGKEKQYEAEFLAKINSPKKADMFIKFREIRQETEVELSE